jgi:hypothetical protein
LGHRGGMFWTARVAGMEPVFMALSWYWWESVHSDHSAF